MEVSAISSGSRQAKLARAILIYGYETPYGEAHASPAIATIHNVTFREKGAPDLLPGRLLTRDELHDMLKQISGAPQVRALLPECVLCCEAGLLVWWRPAARRPIYFKTREAQFNEAVSGKEVLHPSLLFAARHGNLSIFALPGTDRPVGETPLYFAPYFNLYQPEGNMCRGNAVYPEQAVPSSIPLWEDAFFQTNFTHPNSPKLCLHKKGHDGFWRHMARPDISAVPTEWLMPAKLTLAELVAK